MVGRLRASAVVVFMISFMSCSTDHSSDPPDWCAQAFKRLAALPAISAVISFPSEGPGFSEHLSEYRALSEMRGTPESLITQLTALADLADRLQAEVKEGASGEKIAAGPTFDKFLTTGSAFAEAFDEACPPSSVPPPIDPPAETWPTHIGFSPVATTRK
jgi:hypothetical protein